MNLSQTIEFYIKSSSLALSRMYNEIAKAYGITQTIAYILIYVEKEGTPSTKLAWQLGMQDSSLNRQLKKMEADNFITKINDKDDKRIVRIFLTEKGVEHRKLIKKIVLDFNQKLLENINENEINIFYKVFDQIKKQINTEKVNKSKKIIKKISKNYD